MSGISHGSTELISEREKLEFESVPEFVREPRTSPRDSYAANIATNANTTTTSHSTSHSTASQSTSSVEEPDPRESKASAVRSAALPKSAELEALWPGVSHEFLHAPKKGPSFYLGIGFIAGAITSIAVIGGFAAVSHMLTASNPLGKEIVVAQGQPGTGKGQVTASGATGITSTSGEPEVIIPLASIYEVGSGDTLAAIALKNYKRATPRLLDEICKANNLRNANVLSLGQKLSLPEYRPQRQLATGVNTVPQ